MYHKPKTAILTLLFLLQLMAAAASADTVEVPVYPSKTALAVNPAKVVLNGKIYSESIWLEEVSAGKAQAAPDETFLARTLATYQTGTAADVLAVWNPEEREQMATYINNPDLFAANKNWNKGIRYSALLAKIYYGGYVVFMVQHTMQNSSNVVKMYTLTTVDDSFYMSNLLANDPIFVNYLIKIKEQTTFKTKPQ